MASAFFKALGDLGDKRLRAVLWRSLGLSLATAIVLWLAISRGFAHVELIGGTLETVVDILGSVAALLALIVMLPAFLGLYAGLYVETICRAVEARRYPHLAPPRTQVAAEAVIIVVKFGIALMAFNLLLLAFAVFPPLYVAAGWAVNGHLLGREYLEIVGLRRMAPDELRRFRLKRRGKIFGAGLMLAAVASIPFANLLLPLFGTAMMLHVFEDLREPEPQ